MPIYEYICSSCGEKLELIQRISDPAPGTCPSCKASQTMARQVSLSSFQLKGGGWYSDLYSSVPKPSKGESSSEGGASSDGD